MILLFYTNVQIVFWKVKKQIRWVSSTQSCVVQGFDNSAVSQCLLFVAWGNLHRSLSQIVTIPKDKAGNFLFQRLRGKEPTSFYFLLLQESCFLVRKTISKCFELNIKTYSIIRSICKPVWIDKHQRTCWVSLFKCCLSFHLQILCNQFKYFV